MRMFRNRSASGNQKKGGGRSLRRGRLANDGPADVVLFPSQRRIGGAAKAEGAGAVVSWLTGRVPVGLVAPGIWIFLGLIARRRQPGNFELEVLVFWKLEAGETEIEGLVQTVERKCGEDLLSNKIDDESDEMES